jgi:uncharacterized protein (TIGR02452 family)
MDHNIMDLRNQLAIARERARALGHEAIRIIDNNEYVTTTGEHVDLRASIEAAVKGTMAYPPHLIVQDAGRNLTLQSIEVRNETTLRGARRLIDAGQRPVVLNFASATSPGGGFLNGARAQEEYLARSSALHACLRDDPMYGYHRSRTSAIYSDYVIYSPDVPVFRDDDHNLVAPVPVSVLTCAAVNMNRWLQTSGFTMTDTENVMRSRIHKVLSVAVRHGHTSIVLGAWGCGAFGLDPFAIAGLFHDALHGIHAHSFEHVVFSITDWSPEQRFIGPFREIFT